MSNAHGTRDVLDELLWDGSIDASRIAVTAVDATEDVVRHLRSLAG